MKRKKKIVIGITVITVLLVLIGLCFRGINKEDTIVIEDIDIGDLKIDHLVVNVDVKYQENEEIIQSIRNTGFPYMPDKGKGTNGFKVSNIWIGEEYFEMVRIKNEDGGGWVPNWVERYHEGQRGMVCLFLDTEDMASLYARLNDKNMSEPERIKYKFLFNLFSISPPWENAYLPYFEGAPFQIGFQQLDSEKTRERLYKKMTPNSTENEISGIEKIEIYGDFTEEDLTMLSGLFTTIEKDGELIWNLKGGQSISFKKADEYHVKVYVEKSEAVEDAKLMIENIEIIVA